jgi:chromosome segregation ATPase
MEEKREAEGAAEGNKVNENRIQDQAAEMHENGEDLSKIQHDAQESAMKLVNVERERDSLLHSNQQLKETVEQLQSDLHRAAETIAELRMTVAQQEEDERQRQQKEALRVEEEETAMIAAVKSDMQKQMAQLRDSLNAQIVSLENELDEERKSSLALQHEMQKSLEEATTRLLTNESEMTAQLSKKEAKFTKQLQAAEKAAAKAVALLDQKEEEVQQLQAVIADMRETMKKNKVAEDEAEEEMDELHHENEELHHQLEALQKENSELKAKLASMADDSEKLGGLKV